MTDSHAPPVGHMPYCAKSTGAVPRQPSVLWCTIQPVAPYCTRAVRAPDSASWCTIAAAGSQHSARFAGPAGQ
jgi:hypothetical protein